MNARQRTDEAIAELLATERDYAATRADAAENLGAGQRRREQAMRRAAAVGLSHRRIAELTGLSHTRVNQILGKGARIIPEAHLAPGVDVPPPTVASAVLRLMGEQQARRWTIQDLRSRLAARAWPSNDLEEVLIELVTDGRVLSLDEGGFTIHARADAA